MSQQHLLMMTAMTPIPWVHSFITSMVQIAPYRCESNFGLNEAWAQTCTSLRGRQMEVQKTWKGNGVVVVLPSIFRGQWKGCTAEAPSLSPPHLPYTTNRKGRCAHLGSICSSRWNSNNMWQDNMYLGFHLDPLLIWSLLREFLFSHSSS